MSETARLAALHEYAVLDAPADAELAAVVRVAAHVAGVPTATLNLLDEHRQCQLTTVGFVGADSAREDSMCEVVVATGAAVHVADASRDTRFAASPWVTGELAAVRAYASVPLITPDGHVLGTLCAFDTEPKQFTETQITALEDLAVVVLALFERRRQGRATAALAAEAESARSLAEDYANELEARQELTNAVHESIDVAIVACDENGRLTLFNRAARDWHGMEADAGLDPAQWPTHYSLYAEDGVTPLAAEQVPLRVALRDGSVADVEMVIAAEGREPVRVVCAGRALHRADGTPLGAVVSMRDVTVERAQRRELADRERLLATILETAPDAVIVADARGAVTAWNPAAEAMFGWTGAQAIGRRLDELIIPKGLADAHNRGYADRSRTGQSRLHDGVVQVPARRRDGSGLLVELSLASFTWQGERRFHSFLRDVTEREAARERLALANSELAAANDELDRFTATVAHDLKSPLTAITAYTEVVTDMVHDRGAHQALSAISRAADRMAVMIDDLLAHARASHEPLGLREVDLDGIVDDLATELSAGSRPVEITRAPLPAVPGHPTLLRQVMANLLGNAVKYVDPGVQPRVHVDAEWTDHAVTITTTDNGIGIPTDARERVFTLYDRAEVGSGYQGTGIGLSTCRRIVERHGGTIWIEPGVGGGTRVRFTIPLVGQTAPPQRTDSHSHTWHPDQATHHR
ncbi:GAF domain-containing sensor histidine kinase [Actinokineospora cianjurensis]|uniref:Sensor-like histidine kinase SenX3 n=1 Tax=Actinokineospora cianjurensis TaxID=585224 RepID=A0A421B5H0_9PSEU|nr:PAS domain S-box protein [Actinokineospora cianjurensis]RLK59498.1 PAS domain S-box-containing protein [Actinokineospora cianjurensis]